MKKIIALVFFTSVGLVSHGQCADLSISVSSSDTSYVQLYHAGFFLIPSGFENICEWEVTTFSGDIIYQDTTSGDAFEQGLVLFDHSVPILDSMKVTVVITNDIAGIICTLSDTLYWEETEVLPGSFIGNWAILSNNGGVEEEITSATEFHIDDNGIEIFPSLVSDYFQIDGSQDLYSVTILDLCGQVVQTHIDLQRLERVDVSRFPSGTYFVQCRSKDNLNFGVKKIIKN
jgi:hypothetical protein